MDSIYKIGDRVEILDSSLKEKFSNYGIVKNISKKEGENLVFVEFEKPKQPGVAWLKHEEVRPLHVSRLHHGGEKGCPKKDTPWNR